MQSWRKLVSFLNRPFPEDESRFGRPKTAFIISVFITFFLIVFEPFGISNLESERYFICAGFGAMTFITSVLYEYIVGEVLKLKGQREKWTFGKWIFSSLGMMFFISLANFLFARLAFFGYIDWSLFPHMIYGTFMVGIIPVLALGAFALLRSERKFAGIAAEINARSTKQSANGSVEEATIFDIPISHLRYAEALQNYVKIGHVKSSGEFVTKTERATLKQILEQTQGSPIVKCHRSFLVNREAILSTEGNAQGLLLTLADCNHLLPVSRSYISAFREK